MRALLKILKSGKPKYQETKVHFIRLFSGFLNLRFCAQTFLSLLNQEKIESVQMKGEAVSSQYLYSSC